MLVRMIQSRSTAQKIVGIGVAAIVVAALAFAALRATSPSHGRALTPEEVQALRSALAPLRGSSVAVFVDQPAGADGVQYAQTLRDVLSSVGISVGDVKMFVATDAPPPLGVELLSQSFVALPAARYHEAEAFQDAFVTAGIMPPERIRVEQGRSGVAIVVGPTP